MAIGRTDLLFSSIASVCEDDHLNFYVLDRLEHKVFKFSPQGRLLLTFGQKGQGPGDFQSPAGIVLTSKGELAVLEYLSYISLFKTDGTFIRRLDLNSRLGLGYIGPDRFYGWIWRPDDQQQVMVDGPTMSAANSSRKYLRQKTRSPRLGFHGIMYSSSDSR